MLLPAVNDGRIKHIRNRNLQRGFNEPDILGSGMAAGNSIIIEFLYSNSYINLIMASLRKP